MNSYLVSGAGSGIGAAIAKSIETEKGSQLILLGRNESKLEDLRKELKRPDDHLIVVCDISQKDLLRDRLSRVLPDSNLRGVVANAGIGGENHFGDGDRFESIVTTNLFGSYYLAQTCLPFFNKDNDAPNHLIFISSILARLGVPGYSAYCASKAALLGLTRSLAAELSRDNILVNAIAPGWVDTDMATQGLQQMSDKSGRIFEEVRAEQLSMVPLGRMSEPQEIAGLIKYLISPTQRSITGQTLDINNGAMMP